VRSSVAPGPADPSITKLRLAELYRLARDIGIGVIGAEGLLTACDAPLRRPDLPHHAAAPAIAIAGGSDQIQRNILGERVLGLPREPGPSPDTPFRRLSSVR
jgi:alkylation response protein AidB-like acyl-CoA dehydrogenase